VKSRHSIAQGAFQPANRRKRLTLLADIDCLMIDVDE
jgi:hypothetical protein